ncbi:NAD(P)/FAD-dependent oxidoreductase [Streptomyces griseocarneus]|uniref:NAD(P)/FAD-dependent oxidoreductase n=1 Tax=Streptomyces griseocarneus TaxID=51201 RepID=UPI00167D0A31|nr:FAD-dependent oxidoreductase [Streptomyces griseocarneus]MBZ6477991.1 FAD-dependent oxidoreductase [Streptomyces griseocarneus]GHG54698.1 oxidoreductase [Streptomyces griseocarneus]
MSHHIVVVGAGYAGLVAAKRVAGRLRHTDVTVTLINAVDRFVERVRLHQLAAGQHPQDLPLRDLLHGTRVGLLVARVTSVDASARTVHVDRAPHAVGYDTLVYALGSRAHVDAVPGVAEHAHTLAEPAQADRLHRHIARLPSGAGVAVVGGGLTGLEAATELAEARPDLRVALFAGADIGARLSPRARRHLLRALDRLRVTVHPGAPVTEVRENAVVDAEGRSFAADAVIWTAGFRAPALAAEAGFATDADGRMTVDGTLRSVSHPEVYAVGDAAAGHAVDAAVTRMSCQTALPMGRQAADVIAARLTGREPRPVRIRYAFTNISLGRRDGIVQFTRPDDSPRAPALTGRTAALFKEAVVRGTVLAVRGTGPLVPARRRGPRA